MVKGVNKTIIEVNNTGSKVFDRIVFYVNPTCSNMSAKNLNRAIKNFTFQLDEGIPRSKMSLRRKHILRRRAIIASIISGFAIIGVTLAFIL